LGILTVGLTLLERGKNIMTLRDNMTIAEIKAQLPNVKIRIHGKLTTGRVTGRLNEFASVSEFQKLGAIYHFSWEAVQRAVNNNSVLICE
jgi:hypothetical protein